MQLLRKIKLVLTLNCDQSTRLLSDTHERELERHERIGLWFHLRGCSGCRSTRSDFGLLKKIANRIRRSSPPAAPDLPADTRERLQQGLKGK